MLVLVRVDDRLLHGQIICSWAPFMNADALVVASDETAGDEMVSEILSSCSFEGFHVCVASIKDSFDEVKKCMEGAKRTMLIVGTIKDAMRLYDKGRKFTALNLGNVHHADGGRALTPSVIVNEEDDQLLERFIALGVKIDIRDVPTKTPVEYSARKKAG